MKLLSIVGIILVVIGAIGLIYGGLTYMTHRNVVDVGTMHVQVNENNRLLLSPLVSVSSIVIGVVLLVVDRRQTTRG
jgi:hypothetical protein